MKTVNLQVRINEDLKQEVSSILKTQGLSYTSMLDALFRQIIKERRIPFAIALPTAPIDETPTPSTLNNGTYEQPQTTLKASETINRYGNYGNVTPNEGEVAFDTIDKTGVLNIRINPKVKTLTTAILKEMGLTMSQTVTLVSKQIQFNKAIPPTILRPEWIDAINDDLWTKEDLNSRIQIGLNLLQRLAESLEMNHFTFTQELERFPDFRIVDDTDQVVVGGSGLLLGCQVLR